jgi:hypothetical protein
MLKQGAVVFIFLFYFALEYATMTLHDDHVGSIVVGLKGHSADAHRNGAQHDNLSITVLSTDVRN